MRYIVLFLLNIPIILLALINIVTQYKMKGVSRSRFWLQISLWFAILIVLTGSFPFYNYINGKPIFDSSELSLFDIVQTTAIIFLFYVVNDHRRKIERSERVIRDLHQAISIRLSNKQGKDI